MVFAAATALAAAIGLNHLGPQVYRWFQTRRWRRQHNLLALTYDDGPDSQTSAELLDLLDEYQVKATFYLVGFRAERQPEIAQRIASSGHEVGTHSYSHWHAWKTAPWKDLADAARGYDVLAPIAGDQAPFRPPFGKVSLPTFIYMLWKGRRVDWWTSPTNDTDDEFEDVNQVASRMVDGSNPVVLMHSHHDEPHRRAFMLAATRAIIEQAQARGMNIVTMAELDRASQ